MKPDPLGLRPDPFGVLHGLHAQHEPAVDHYTLVEPDYTADSIAAAIERLPKKWQTEYGDGAIEVGTGVYLHGPVGTGKTYEAAGIAHAAIHEGKCVEWVTTSAWLFKMRESFGGGIRAASIENLVRADLLIIDEIWSGDTSDKEWKKDAIDVLVNAVYENNTPMVVTSNLTFSNLRDQLGARVTDRLVERCRDIPMVGRSKRLDVALERKKEGPQHG